MIEISIMTVKYIAVILTAVIYTVASILAGWVLLSVLMWLGVTQ